MNHYCILISSIPAECLRTSENKIVKVLDNSLSGGLFRESQSNNLEWPVDLLNKAESSPDHACHSPGFDIKLECCERLRFSKNCISGTNVASYLDYVGCDISMSSNRLS